MNFFPDRSRTNPFPSLATRTGSIAASESAAAIPDVHASATTQSRTTHDLRLLEVVLKYDAIAGLARFQMGERLVHARHREHLGDRRDLVPAAEIEHLGGRRGATQGRPGHRLLSHQERKDRDRNRLANGPDKVKAALRRQAIEVGLPRQTHIDGGDNEVE